jgi:hypothetical protein
MMQGFGNSLESIEVQSELLRNLILERWNAEVKRRELDRQISFDLILSDVAFSGDAARLYEQIRDDKGDADDTAGLAELFKEISALGSASPREVTWLALLLARISGDQEHLEFAGMQTRELLRQTDLLTSGQIDKSEIAYLPLALSACGDLQSAIDQSQYLITSIPELDEDVRMFVKFNLANFLVENACFGSPLGDDELAHANERVSSLLAECANFKDENISAFLDVQAMSTVVFSRDPVALRDAIDLLYDAKVNAPDGEADQAASCYELHVRVAWRKLLEIEQLADRV